MTFLLWDDWVTSKFARGWIMRLSFHRWNHLLIVQLSWGHGGRYDFVCHSRCWQIWFMYAVLICCFYNGRCYPPKTLILLVIHTKMSMYSRHYKVGLFLLYPFKVNVWILFSTLVLLLIGNFILQKNLLTMIEIWMCCIEVILIFQRIFLSDKANLSYLIFRSVDSRCYCKVELIRSTLSYAALQ